jgi:hypothetical protein
MTKPRGRWRFSWGFVVFAALLAVRCDSGLREDELECERAAIHVRDCCPEVPSRAFDCQYIAPDSCGGGSDPDVNADEGRCLRETSCATLRAGGTCASIAKIGAAGGSTSSSTSPPSARHRSICVGAK